MTTVVRLGIHCAASVALQLLQLTPLPPPLSTPPCAVLPAQKSAEQPHATQPHPGACGVASGDPGGEWGTVLGGVSVDPSARATIVMRDTADSGGGSVGVAISACPIADTRKAIAAARATDRTTVYVRGASCVLSCVHAQLRGLRLRC